MDFGPKGITGLGEIAEIVKVRESLGPQCVAELLGSCKSLFETDLLCRGGDCEQRDVITVNGAPGKRNTGDGYELSRGVLGDLLDGRPQFAEHFRQVNRLMMRVEAAGIGQQPEDCVADPFRLKA